MVLGLLVIAAIPTVTGVAQGISSKKTQNAQMKEKIKFNMTATLSVNGGPPTEAWIVLRNGRMYIDHPDAPLPGHKFNGYYFKYPSEQGYQGMVSTIADDPPILNWLYVDKHTGAVCYAGRKDTEGHIIGPWGWSEDEQFLVIDDDDWRFIAVEEDVPDEAEGETVSGAQQEEEGAKQGNGGSGKKKKQKKVKCWAVYLSRDQNGYLKPKAEQPKEGEDSEDEESEDSEDEDEDVRYTSKWAPIKLVRKLQLGVQSGWEKGPRPAHQRQ